MDGRLRKKLVLFTNSFPYGNGETFLAQELPYLAAEFDYISIFPLYRPQGEGTNATQITEGSAAKELPANCRCMRTLLPFDHKDKWGLLRKGLFCRAPFFFAIKEFCRALLGVNIKVENPDEDLRFEPEWIYDGIDPKKDIHIRKKARIGKRLKIFANYFLMLRTILGNKGLMEEVVRECSNAQILYFYWGDKSVMMAPFLKKKLAKKVEVMPKICVRFHGSDLYERAKGYLPFRKMIMRSTDYAAPVSEDGKNYILKNYRHAPKEIKVWHLGTPQQPKEQCINLMQEPFSQEAMQELKLQPTQKMAENLQREFNIVGCSNLIPLKRVEVILSALQLLMQDSRLKERGYNRITYTHFGGGPLLDKLRQMAAQICKEAESSKENKPIGIKIEFKGQTPNNEILRYYKERGADLFLLVSRSEGVPVSIMEAMSCGIPFMVTDVGGVREFFSESENRDFVQTYRWEGECMYMQYNNLLHPMIWPQELMSQIFDFMHLPQHTRMSLRQKVYQNHAENWSAEKNYSRFAQELAGVAAPEQ